MLITIAVILAALWLLGMITSATAGGLLHILLIIAVVMVIIRLAQGKPLL